MSPVPVNLLQFVHWTTKTRLGETPSIPYVMGCGEAVLSCKSLPNAEIAGPPARTEIGERCVEVDAVPKVMYPLLFTKQEVYPTPLNVNVNGIGSAAETASSQADATAIVPPTKGV